MLALILIINNFIFEQFINLTEKPSQKYIRILVNNSNKTYILKTVIIDNTFYARPEDKTLNITIFLNFKHQKSISLFAGYFVYANLYIFYFTILIFFLIH